MPLQRGRAAVKGALAGPQRRPDRAGYQNPTWRVFRSRSTARASSVRRCCRRACPHGRRSCRASTSTRRIHFHRQRRGRRPPRNRVDVDAAIPSDCASNLTEAHRQDYLILEGRQFSVGRPEFPAGLRPGWLPRPHIRTIGPVDEAQAADRRRRGLVGGRQGRHRGRVEQSNFNGYDLLRMDEAPVIDVHIAQNTEPPVGAGESTNPPIVAAIANAVLAATGKRIRHVPIVAKDLA